MTNSKFCQNLKGKTNAIWLHCNERKVQKTKNNVNQIVQIPVVYEVENVNTYDFVGCKFHRSAGVQLAVHCNGHHWRRRQLFYKLPTAVTPAASMVCPARQAAADLSCPGMPIAQVGFSVPWQYIEIFPKPRFNDLPSQTAVESDDQVFQAPE